MSGGSMEYLCFKVDDVADELVSHKAATRKAFGKHLKKVAHALHEIEWVDSGDKGDDCDVKAIRALFGDDYIHREVDELLIDAREIIKQLKDFGA